MSNYPPDDLCQTVLTDDDDESLLTTTNNYFYPNTLLILCSVLCILMIIDRFWLIRESYGCCIWNYKKGYNDDRDTPTIIDEMTKLKRHRSWTKMRSYDDSDLDDLPSAA
jgi:hypothetical protein